MATTPDLPSLPEPDLGMPWRVNAASDGSAHSAAFTADQMRAYGLAAYELGARSTAAQPADPSLVKEFRATGLTGAEAVAAARGLAGLQEAAERAAAQPVEPIDFSADLTKAKNLLVRIWDKHPDARSMIEGATGSWFVWGTDRDAASGDSTPPSEPAGLTDDRIKRHTLRAADCPPDSKVLLVSSVRRFLAAQGDPSGAPRAEPEAVGPDCHGLDTPERVRFYEHDFYVLSNFSAFNVAQGGFMFQTAEHLYHYMKFARPWGDEDRGKPIDWSGPEILVAQAIFGATSAHEAFKIAEQNKALRRPDWDQVKVSFMRDILRAKAMQHSYVLRKLLATGDRELVEDSWRDDFWGWGPNRDGKNMLGRLWMEVRAEFRAAEPPQAASGSRGD